MTEYTEKIRNKALEIMADNGKSFTRNPDSKGPQWLGTLADGKTVLLKTAGKGGLLVKALGDQLSGFQKNFSHVLAAVCLPNQDEVSAYLIPKDIVEKAYKKNRREWSIGRESLNNTWALNFHNTRQDYFGSDMATHWSQYLIGTKSLRENVSSTASPSPQSVLEQAKQDIATAYGIHSSQVTITITA